MEPQSHPSDELPRTLDQALGEIVPPVGPWDAGDHEGTRLDFKETPETSPAPEHRWREARRRLLDDVVETAVSLANAEGGLLVIGVRNKAAAGEPIVAGVDLDQWSSKEVRDKIFESTAPHLAVIVQPVSLHGATVLAVDVPKGTEVYGTTRGVFKWRREDRNQPLDEATMRGLRASRNLYDWSAEPTELAAHMVSRAALEEAAGRLRQRGADDLANLAVSDPGQYLRDCGLLDAEGRLRRAGVLLYGDADALRAAIPHWGVLLRTAPSPGAEGTVLLRRDETRKPLASLIDDLLLRLSSLVNTQTIRAGAQQIDLTDYPPDAQRELLANAFAHRDWETPGIVEVLHTPYEMTVSSPGGLLPNVHPETLLRETAPRNPLLAREMARLRLAEQAGQGFDRVYRELARIGKPPPIVEDGASFRVTLPGGTGDAVIARFVASGAVPALQEDLDLLLVLLYLRDHRTISASKVSGTLQREPVAVQRVLERGAADGLWEATKGTARRSQPSYRLTQQTVAAIRSALRYRTATIDGDDQKLIRHLQRNGRITNADVRDYLDCDVYLARDRLTRLRKRGWIDFLPGGPTRGSDVVYVKTEKFDAR
jgi:ATP-dependent DNA helicase RecG